jgi:hypothetical protein
LPFGTGYPFGIKILACGATTFNFVANLLICTEN